MLSCCVRWRCVGAGRCGALKYSLFIPHHRALNTTLRAVASAMAFGPSRVIVVDSSADGGMVKY